LENLLGQRLFFRTTKGLTLTPEGAVVQAHAEEMAQTAARLSFTGAQAQTLSGTIRIAACQISASYLLPKMLTTLRQKNSDLQIEVVASVHSENLLRREADLAVRMYRPTQNDLITRKVADLNMGLFASKAYVEMHGLPETLQDLGRHTVIGYDRSTLIIEGMRKAGFAVDRSFFGFRSDDQMVGWQMLLEGMGIGIVPQLVGQSHPDVVQLWPDMYLANIPVWLTAHRELRMSPRVRLTFDHLAKCFSAL